MRLRARTCSTNSFPPRATTRSTPFSSPSSASTSDRSSSSCTASGGRPARVQRAAHHLGQRAVRLRRLAPALEQDGVARAEGERGDLDQRIGTRLEDHREHAQRAAFLRQDQPLVELAAGEHGPERIGTRRELPCAVGQRLQLRGVQLQPLHQRRGEADGRGEVAHVRLQHPGAHRRVDQRRRQRLERPRARLGGTHVPGGPRPRPPAAPARSTALMTRAPGCRG